MCEIRLMTTITAPNLRRFRLMCLLVAALAPLVLNARSSALAQVDDGMGDALIIKLQTSWDMKDSSFYLYNPGRQPLDVPSDAYPFSWNANGLLAYSSGEGSREVFVLDTKVANSSPVNISQSPTVDDNLEGWSPDGSYLAFTSGDINFRLHLWDGEKVIDVMPDEVAHLPGEPHLTWSGDSRVAFISHASQEAVGMEDLRLYVWDGTTTNISPVPFFPSLAWSADGRLAFVAGQDEAQDIWVWDGMRTLNVSRSPTQTDNALAWSADGRLAFRSKEGERYAISIWDGVSFREGLPDRDTFTRLSNDFISWFSFPMWTPENNLVFYAVDPLDGLLQIYQWEGETLADISQNPGVHNAAPRWAADGKWAFVTQFSARQEVLIRDADNQLLLRTSGQYTAEWSWNGYLAFCDRSSEPNQWTLNVWDGASRASIASGHNITAQWQSGASITCTFG